MSPNQIVRYPFSAVVGQDELRLALILTAISPRIGGVVIRGEKGTAKTTTVRAFAGLLDGAPLVNLHWVPPRTALSAPSTWKPF